MYSIGERERIRQGRGRFLCMAMVFSLGVFNDNFFKQAALLLAVAAGREQMQGYATVIFTLPFLLFAAPAGWAADRYPKSRVVMAAKSVEFLAMLCGAAGIVSGHWILIFAMLGLMGLQAAFLSPAVNGSIPEVYPTVYVPRANAILRMAITAAILGGVASAGLALNQQTPGWRGIPLGRLIIGAGVIGIAAAGMLLALFVPHRPAANAAIRFPWDGPVTTLRNLYETRHDPSLSLTIAASVFIWLMGSLQILLINPLGVQQFKLGEAMTSYLIVAQLVGIGIGGFFSGQRGDNPRWYRILGPSGVAFSLLMMAMPLLPLVSGPAVLRIVLLYVFMTLIGVAGGLFLIPVESYMQIRPAPGKKGTVLAAANFAVFGGILLSGLISNALNACLRPTTGFGVAGAFALVFSVVLHILYKRRVSS